MFFDPTGRHLIITTETGDNYYLFSKWKKAKMLTKIRVRRDTVKVFLCNGDVGDEESRTTYLLSIQHVDGYDI
jgi:hypothetical protein